MSSCVGVPFPSANIDPYNERRLSISVIVPSRPQDPHLKRCLGALRPALPSGSEVIVVGDGWTPDSPNAEGEILSLRVLSHPKAGPAACRDFGARQAMHEWLCFVDSDVLVHRDAFTRSTAILEESGDDGLVGSYDDDPEDQGTVSRFRNLLHHYHHQRNAGTTGVFWGAFGIVRRAAYLDVGGFDPDYTDASVEDIELGYRLAEKGYRIALRPEVQVTHLKRWTLDGMVRTDVMLRAKPWTILLHRHRNRFSGTLNTAARERFSATLSVSGLSSLLFSMTGILPAYTTAACFFVFILVQWEFYAFISKRAKPVFLPAFFLLHQVYFLSAVCGWLLARYEILNEKR